MLLTCLLHLHFASTCALLPKAAWQRSGVTLLEHSAVTGLFLVSDIMDRSRQPVKCEQYNGLNEISVCRETLS